MKREYTLIQADFVYDEQGGDLTIETSLDWIRLDRDEVVTLAEKLRDWVLQDDL